MRRTRSIILLAVIALANAAVAPAHAAQEALKWPAKPVRIVVAFPAGSTNDLVARVVGERLAERLKASFVVDNRPGAGGNIGTDAVAKAAPDGYTLILASNGALATNRFVYKSMPFDADRDFTPIVLVGEIPIVIAVGAKVPVGSLTELVALARAQPGKINVASPGNGTIGHFALLYLNTLTGATLGHVPYKGGAPALTDVLNGTVEAIATPVVGFVSQLQSGALKGLALASETRLRELPNVPTAREQGIDMQAASLVGLLGPAGLPASVVALLNAEVNAFIGSDDGRKRMSDAGLRVVGGPPQALARALAEDVAKWTRVVKTMSDTGTLPKID